MTRLTAYEFDLLADMMDEAAENAVLRYVHSQSEMSPAAIQEQGDKRSLANDYFVYGMDYTE